MSDDEKLLRRVRGRVHSILDTLTVDNADKLSEDLAALLINSASLLKGLVTIIVDKALAEQSSLPQDSCGPLPESSLTASRMCMRFRLLGSGVN